MLGIGGTLESINAWAASEDAKRIGRAPRTVAEHVGEVKRGRFVLQARQAGGEPWYVNRNPVAGFSVVHQAEAARGFPAASWAVWYAQHFAKGHLALGHEFRVLDRDGNVIHDWFA